MWLFPLGNGMMRVPSWWTAAHHFSHLYYKFIDTLKHNSNHFILYLFSSSHTFPLSFAPPHPTQVFIFCCCFFLGGGVVAHSILLLIYGPNEKITGTLSCRFTVTFNKQIRRGSNSSLLCCCSYDRHDSHP